jgi:hypothetical protein
MTEKTDATAELPEREIEFHGRAMWVRIPRPEQLLVWRRILAQLQTIDQNDWTGETVMAALDRLRKIIDSILVHTTDSTWIDDQMLDGTLAFQDLAQIITKAVEAFAPEENRADRRAAKAAPAKKAVRKAPAKKATPAKAR